MTKQSNIFTGPLGLPLLEENHQFRRYSKNSHFDHMHPHWPWLWRYSWTWWWWLLLYCAVLHSQADSLCSHVILHEWLSFYSMFFEYPLMWCTYSAGMAGATWNCCCLSASSVYTIQPCHFMKSPIHKVHMCFSCNLPPALLAEGQDLLHATVVTWGWNGYWNRTQHRTLTL